MAISMLQDAQNRTALAAALAGIQQRDREVPRSLSLSPTMSANSSHSAIYPTGLPQTGIGTTPFSLIPASHLFAANRQAAVAFMAAQLPIPSLASTFFPHHPAALFGSWPTPPPNHINATQQYQQNGHLTPTQSPPASPNSPASSTSTLAAAAAAAAHCHENNNNEQRKGKEAMTSKLISPPISNNNNNNINNNNNNKPIQINGHNDGPAKKSRKLSVKKGLISLAMATITTTTTTATTTTTTTAINVSDLYGNTTAPISPPSSSSSPNSSTHEFNSPSGSGNNTITITQQRSHHDINLRDKTFTCKICSRSFGYKHVLQNHERTHTGEKPFECPECHKRFTRDHHLKTHMRLHTGEKPYHCSHCDRQFVQVANLRRHLRVHTGEKPYTCEVCEGKFSDSNQLKAHMMVHNGEKPFECERCHQKFRRRHHLINHKCELLSPISPISSPGNVNAQPNEAADDEFIPITVTNCDEKSYCVSEESFDTANNNNNNNNNDDKDNDDDDDKSNIKPLLCTLYPNTEEDENYEDVPLDLSEEGCNNNIQDLRLMYRLPASSQHILHMTQLEMPVQTEPEDLSIRTDREKKQEQMNKFSPDKQLELNDYNNDSRSSSSSSSSGLIN